MIKNLGIFRGEHFLNLMASDPKKPIVLVGALNGSGKTTVIEALQLALYGKRAEYGWRGASSYTQYLAQIRNRYAKPIDPTAAEVTIRLADGKELRVQRQWSFLRDSPHEFVSVFVNGADEPDVALSESWDDEVERILPARLSELFFFDGERIERLADPTKSGEVLRVAVSSLLGLDLVDHLVEDLEILRARQRQKLLSEVDQSILAALETRRVAVKQAREDICQRKSQLQSRLDHVLAQLKSCQQRLLSQGGDRFQQRESVVDERARVAAQLSAAERHLRDVAAGILPLALVRHRLEHLQQECVSEATIGRTLAPAAIRSQLEQFLKWIETRKYPARIHKEISDHVSKHLRELPATSAIRRQIDWPQLAHELTALLGNKLVDAGKSARALTAEIGALAERLHVLEEQLSRMPEQEQLAVLFREQGAAEAAKQALQVERGVLDQEERRLAQKEAEMEREREVLLARTLASEDAARTADYCERSIRTLSNFRGNLFQQRREQLQQFILEAFRILARKSDLVTRLTINADSMAITLQTESGAMISAQQLSAGERQLLAVAMLWGLARASGRPVPVVIDTPLGRLDGEHRRALVERYFPDASHQVILLSTDQEVDADYSRLLEGAVAHRYTIDYDPSEASSSFSTGYFAA